MSDLAGSEGGPVEPNPPGTDGGYEPPRLESLGTLADLTRGGSSGQGDGNNSGPTGGSVTLP
jgi:hypothetical protein